jgi:uncharacterized protein (DUF58 family)
MIPTETLRRIRQIEIRTKHLVSDQFSGQYHSVFKGRGVEFSEVREYQIGDDTKTIDWKVTARMGHPYVKRFVEERELTVMLVVDASASGLFGTLHRTRRDLAAEICAVLAFSAIRNNDRVGLIIFTDHVEKFVPPKKGTRHVLRLIRDLLYFKPQGRSTDLNEGLDYLNEVARHRSVVFVVSDFLTILPERMLRVTCRRHDLICISITDPREMELPAIGLVHLRDLETGRDRLIDTSNPVARKAFEANARHAIEERNRLFRSIGIDHIPLSVGPSYVEPLIAFFRKRARRYR